MLRIILLFLLSPSLAAAEPPRKIVSPIIEDGILIIEGSIDSHIYDYLTFPNPKMDSVHSVRLNSFGGNHNWGMAIAEKIQQRGWTTRLNRGDICASACVYIFGAGQKRIAHSTAWFGIHGARLGAGYMVEFAQQCLDGETLVDSPECQELEKKNYDLNLNATREAFQLIENTGVSEDLWNTYWAFEDTPKWFLNFNFIKKPDWVLTAPEALDFQLVTALVGPPMEEL